MMILNQERIVNVISFDFLLVSCLSFQALVYVVMVKEECSRQVAEHLFGGHQGNQSEVTDDVDNESDNADED